VPPQRGESWLNAKPDDPVPCAAPVAAVGAVYPQAPAVAQDGGHGSSPAEKTGIPALERAAPTLPRPPGLVERPEDADLRPGTPGLIANGDVAPGEVVAPTIGPSRTAEAFAAPLARTLATDPEAPWLCSVAQLHTHTSEAVVRLVASACDIAEDLGEQEQSGIRQSRPTRATFLSDASQRLRCMYTPKHTSGRNQSDLWFSLLVRRLLRRGHCTSVEHVRERLLAFMPYFNTTMAKPFKWTDKGRPLTV
jgi:DDE superfamily endonuclease